MVDSEHETSWVVVRVIFGVIAVISFIVLIQYLPDEFSDYTNAVQTQCTVLNSSVTWVGMKYAATWVVQYCVSGGNDCSHQAELVSFFRTSVHGMAQSDADQYLSGHTYGCVFNAKYPERVRWTMPHLVFMILLLLFLLAVIVLVAMPQLCSPCCEKFNTSLLSATPDNPPPPPPPDASNADSYDDLLSAPILQEKIPLMTAPPVTYSALATTPDHGSAVASDSDFHTVPIVDREPEQKPPQQHSPLRSSFSSPSPAERIAPLTTHTPTTTNPGATIIATADSLFQTFVPPTTTTTPTAPETTPPTTNCDSSLVQAPPAAAAAAAGAVSEEVGDVPTSTTPPPGPIFTSALV
eukprot:gnl/Spiro4/9222_TR4857_c0_g1_i1.p1 gnl/Spiro4/9222_TR4857_c0_g1~~gnl/Spiro4/9222_TR4857_c0_g1_i1.p1  ORF type:complete len:352 (-),score=79.20 gnl/Spiro4/9222_TR4857_c0_g1_i1:19-1074(-)